MLNPNGRLGTLQLCWHVLHAMRSDLMLALVLTLVCHLLIPPVLELKLSPKVLLPLLGIFGVGVHGLSQHPGLLTPVGCTHPMGLDGECQP
jgi:hypothetical protein